MKNLVSMTPLPVVVLQLYVASIIQFGINEDLRESHESCTKFVCLQLSMSWMSLQIEVNGF